MHHLLDWFLLNISRLLSQIPLTGGAGTHCPRLHLSLKAKVLAHLCGGPAGQTCSSDQMTDLT